MNIELLPYYQKLERLRALPTGWNSYDAEPPNDRACAAAACAIPFLEGSAGEHCTLWPWADGGVTFSFVRYGREREAHIRFGNDGELHLVLLSGRKRDAAVNVIEGAPQELVAQAAAWLEGADS